MKDAIGRLAETARKTFEAAKYGRTGANLDATTIQNQETWAATMRAVLAAIQTDPFDYLEVNPLVWVDGDDGVLFAGVYEITESRKRLYIHKIQNGDVVMVPEYIDVDNEAAAQAAAQAHHENHLKECIR